jgi:DNA-binding beta-propeller fold protein YncE
LRAGSVQNTGTMPRLCAFCFVVVGVGVGLAACGSSDLNGSDAPPGTADAAPADASPADAPPTVVAGPGAKLTFESGPVRPLALSPDGTRLFVANIANGSLDVLRVTGDGLAFDSSVYVGIDPVAVAARDDGEVWVVNHVSDDVSVVDVSHSPPRVVRTLLVGDEPSDIVFAGPGRARAFITTAHRGQQRTSPDLSGVPGAGDPQLTTAAVGRADVWVFDTADLGTALGGRPIAILTLRGDTPRALAVTPDGSTVYAAILNSGNQTTVTGSLLSCAGFGHDTPCTVDGTVLPGGAPGPGTNHAGVPAPRVGVILKADENDSWLDILGRDWTDAVRFTLPDEDVFRVDAASLATTSVYRHVGTTLINMAVNPQSGVVYVSNTESRNDLRFEGPGTFAGSTLQGHLAEARITVIDAGGVVRPRHLNKHIPYDTLPAPAGVKEKSLATPLEVAVSADGATVYVAAFGSGKVGVLPAAALEADTFDPAVTSAGYIAVTGGGPGGLALDETRHRLYVATRFDDGVSVVNLDTRLETSHLTLPDPEPPKVVQGRPFLYDAVVSSSNGEAACASCHIFGDMDHVAWDLGNPDADAVFTPINIKLAVGAPGDINGSGDATALHPMKGPMTTQTLRGMINHGPMHWRGDRVSGFFGTDNRTQAPFDSELAFKNFIVAFEGLVGRATMLDPNAMQAFSDFALSIVLPPNPVRALDNSLTDSQARGRRFFMGCDGLDSIAQTQVVCVDDRPVGDGHFSDGVGFPGFGFTCEGCHTLRPDRGFFGTDGESSFEALPQIHKVPHLRNVYAKVGMFGNASEPAANAGDNGDKGAQIRGFGFENDGSVDTLFRFLQARVFNRAQAGRVGFADGDPQRRDVEQFLLAFDNDLAPIVGQQVTLRSDNAAAAGPRIALLIARAKAPFVSQVLGAGATECDLVARGVIGGSATTFHLRTDGMFAPEGGGSALSDAALRALAQTAGQEITYTCLPPGWGARGAH